jgi:hypothetical protein
MGMFGLYKAMDSSSRSKIAAAHILQKWNSWNLPLYPIALNNIHCLSFKKFDA